MKSPMDAEVIVVGGGPGGAMAARTLAQAGAKVLLLEKARFPRYKPCGGALSAKVLALGPDVSQVVEDKVTEVIFAAPGEEPIQYRAENPLAYMVQRERFDQLLLNRAQEVGVKVRFGHRVLRAKEVAGGMEVVSDKGAFRAPVLIGADGAHGAVRRSFSLPPSRIVLAMDARISVSEEGRNTWRGKALIDFGTIPFGYAWVFPKVCEVSTGVLGEKERVGGLPGYLNGFLNGQETLSGPRRVAGWSIPLPAWSLNPGGSSRVLLVGDAAGLVDPFTGEGIYYAMQSGILAATAILHGKTQMAERYRTLVRETFEADFRGAAILAGIIHRIPRWSFRALKSHPGAIEAFAAVLRGELTYVAFFQKVVRWCLVYGWRKFPRVA